jgi:wyosine [tRNA(Phe)-imidazoG37] synthetase (radical SAM superfamily)
MPKLLFADPNGTILVHPQLKACGMKASQFFRLKPEDLIRLPQDSRFFMLPRRRAVGYNSATGGFVSADVSAVAAFLPPGYTTTYNSAYKEVARLKALPLFSYAAAAFYKGEFSAAALRVDKDIRHDSRFINLALVRKNAKILKKALFGNRLVKHLENCALVYGCPNAQNLFLNRFEGPLPTSPSCNAECAGCISYQKKSGCSAAQPRILFVPTPEEIAEIALFHIRNTPNPIVSFGQGCEGEPLLQGTLIEKSICLIRKVTSKGIINMNTNGSRPDILRRLFDVGLVSVRISMNSCRKEYYDRYYKPRGYAFKDVLESIRAGKSSGAFISINYLTMPGFTDSKDEFRSFRALVRKYGVDMVQWRNLNYDPMRYFETISARVKRNDLVGIKEEMHLLKKEFPRLRMGYFNPFSLRVTASPRQLHHD